MIDLSITQDPKWIKAREKLWKPISKYLKDGLRKDELEGVHHYFLTGQELPGQQMGDGASFSWFPIQTPKAWDYLFQYVIKDESEFEFRFYFSFEDLTRRALNAEQQLAMWDYFAGDVFQPVVTSRVPVGKKGERVSFEVDKGRVASLIGCFFNEWARGIYKHKSPKYVDRINYYLSMLTTLSNDDFLEKGYDNYPVSQVGGCVTLAFVRISHPQYSDKFAEEELSERKEFFNFLYSHLENMEMPTEMRAMWEKVKKGEIK